MTSWANQFDDLKNQFVARSKERLVAIESLLARLQAAPADVALLKQTMQHFHWLAGSGGTYGFDDITSWGTYGEELCDYLLKLGGPVSAEDHQKLTTALNTVDQLFAAQTPVSTRVIEEVQPQIRNTLDLLVPPGSAMLPSLQETANKSSGNNSPSSNSGAYTPPPVLGSSSGQSLASTTGSYQSPQASKPAGTGKSLFSTASLSGAAPASSGSPLNATVNTQSGPTPYSNQTDSNPRVSGSPPYGNQTDSNPRVSGSPPYGNQTDSNPRASGSPPYGSQTDSDPRGSSLNTSPASQTAASGIPGNRDIRTTSELPVQSMPQSGEGTRVLGHMGGPPVSSRSFVEETLRPVGQTARPGAAPVSEPRRSSRLSHIPTDRKFALFVDNNLSNLTPVKAALEERGLLIEGVTTASEAKGLFAERLPDVFIVGAPLIDNNGYELVEYLRGLEAGHKPIVIVLAQQAVFLDKVYAIRSGADAFFEYPSELTDLIEKINTLLERDKNENYKVLSVEDDPDMANFIKLTLQSAGYTVMHISDPKTFEEHFLSFEPDLVMLDVVLGEMTGFEIAKYIRQNDRFAPLPIVFLTTQNKLHQHIRSAIAGGDEHLIKPVAPQLLIATVASRLERARSLKRLIDRDGLTRCLNFGSFMERAQKLATADGYRSAPAMMMIDVDNMKKINEKMGFAAGDRIISNIANMLLKGFRNTDLIARFGNDQFAIVLEHLNAQQLQSLSSQVLGAISGTPQLVKGRSVSVTCSGGVSILEQGMTVQQWLDSAQDSLRKAKDAGGNRAIVKPPGR